MYCAVWPNKVCVTNQIPKAVSSACIGQEGEMRKCTQQLGGAWSPSNILSASSLTSLFATSPCRAEGGSAWVLRLPHGCPSGVAGRGHRLNEVRRYYVAGGGFKHGQHLHFDPQNPPPLCDLSANMLQRVVIETDHFGTRNGTLPGLAMG
jgi:hypothetical protein